MPGIAAWWCKGAWEKAAALAKIPDSTAAAAAAAGPCEGASDDHQCAGRQLITSQWSSSGGS